MKYLMKPHVWYSRPEGKKGEHTQYGLVTANPEIHYSIYFAPTPWGGKEDEISFANFENAGPSYLYGLEAFEPSGQDNYLWFKVSHDEKISRQSIAKAFGEQFVHIR